MQPHKKSKHGSQGTTDGRAIDANLNRVPSPSTEDFCTVEVLHQRVKSKQGYYSNPYINGNGIEFNKHYKQ